jgi:hypothetical protein
MQKLRETHLHQLTKTMAKPVVVFVVLVVAVFVVHHLHPLQVHQHLLRQQKVAMTKQLLSHAVRLVLALLVQLVHSVLVHHVFLQRTHQHLRLWKQPETVKAKHV